VFEVVGNHDGDTYRAVYVVRFREVVYVLHAFQKKSPSGIRTARTDVELIARRLRLAQQDHEARYGKTRG
jgi:phage-related protein